MNSVNDTQLDPFIKVFSKTTSRMLQHDHGVHDHGAHDHGTEP
jgi:hypothetical protein